MTRFMQDTVLHELWRQLSSEQRVALLVLHQGKPEDITLGDVRAIRIELPEENRPWIQVQPDDMADYLAREIVANDRVLG